MRERIEEEQDEIPSMMMKLLVLLASVVMTTVQGFVIPRVQLSMQRQAAMVVPSRSPPTNSRQNLVLFNSMIEELEDRYLELATKSEGVMAKPEIVYIMMYNPGTPEEGVHTTEYPKGSGADVMLAFESLEECVAFSNLIRDDKSVPLEPIPTPTPLQQMEMAVQSMGGLTIKIVPTEETE